MKLYYSPGACSLAAHITLREAERRFDLERVDLRTHRTASGGSYYAVNPKGYVPTLELDEHGTERLTELQVVLQYIADLVPEKQLAAPSGTFLRYHLQEWLGFIATELHKQFGPLFRPDYHQSVHQKQRGKIGERLAYLEDVLADRPFLLGDHFTIADAYLFVMLQWTHKVGIDLPIWPVVDAYEARLVDRPSVRAAMSAEGIPVRQQWKRSA